MAPWTYANASSAPLGAATRPHFARSTSARLRHLPEAESTECVATMPRSWPPRACLPDRREDLSHSMRPATVQPPKVAIRWITLPSSSVPMLSFPMVVPCQPFRNSGFRSAFTRSDGPQFFSSYLLSGGCSLFTLFSAVVPFVFSSLQPLFAKHPGWGVLFP